MHKTLKSKGLKVTSSRLSILDILEKSTNKHLSAEEIYQMLKSQNNPTSFGTVYRVLTQFEKAGIVQKQTFLDNRGVIYELAADQPHHHLICLKTSKIEEFFDPRLDQIIQEIVKEKKWELSDYHINIYGISKKTNETV